jgi:N-glycosylase/DNA lyase
MTRESRDWSVDTPAGFSFRRSVLSHGWYALPPFRFDRSAFSLRRVLRLGSGRIVEIHLAESPRGARVQIETRSARLSRAERADLETQVRHMLRLDEDYAGFYETASAHAAFAWIGPNGAGRLLRSPTVFEDLVKLICTTNCTWSLTEVMVGNLVASLGEPAEGTDPSAPRAFPRAETMAARPARFYEKEVRAGYRAAALAELSKRVAEGRLDVESWLDPSLSAAEITKQILSVRGAGPYTAESLLKLLGRYEGLAIDSWCRAKYLRLYGRSVRRRAADGVTPALRRAQDRAIVDASMARRYARFGPWKGLALWCDLTKDWMKDGASVGGEGDKF